MSPKSARRRAVFLDRDGTVIADAGYPRDPAQVALLPGAAEALRQLRQAGFTLVTISNQSGLGRGIVTPDEADRVHRRFVQVLEEAGVPLDGAYYCPHAPDDGCSCRKPSPEMIFRASEELGIEVEGSYMVGDKPADVESGRRAGCRTVFLDWENSPYAGQGGEADFVARNWEQAAACIVGGGNLKQDDN